MATKLDELLAAAAVEHLGEDAGLGSITAWVELHKAAPDLLKAAQRSLQYVVVAFKEGQNSGLSEATLDIARRDYKMIEASIAKATQT